MERSYQKSGSVISEARTRNEKVRNIGLLIGLSGQLYFLSISRVSDVYIDFIKGQWVAWRERCISGDSKPSEVKVIATGGSFDYVIAKTEAYLKKLRR